MVSGRRAATKLYCRLRLGSPSSVKVLRYFCYHYHTLEDRKWKMLSCPVCIMLSDYAYVYSDAYPNVKLVYTYNAVCQVVYRNKRRMCFLSTNAMVATTKRTIVASVAFSLHLGAHQKRGQCHASHCLPTTP